MFTQVNLNNNILTEEGGDLFMNSFWHNEHRLSGNLKITGTTCLQRCLLDNWPWMKCQTKWFVKCWQIQLKHAS